MNRRIVIKVRKAPELEKPANLMDQLAVHEPFIKTTSRNKLEMKNKFHKKVRSIDAASRGIQTSNLSPGGVSDYAKSPSYLPAAGGTSADTS